MDRQTGNGRLLSIGDISKFTGVGVKALRYYERINILKPVYVNPDSRYRYYTFDQVNVVMLIQLALEGGVPLKKLQRFLDEQGNVDIQSFVAHVKKTVAAKLQALNMGLRYFDDIEKAAAVQSRYAVGELYLRHWHEQYYLVKPYGKPFTEGDDYEITKLIFEDSYFGGSAPELLEWGRLAYHTPEGTARYVFVEAPPPQRSKKEPNWKIMPAGDYWCRQAQSRQIEDVATIFSDYLKGADRFIAIEIFVLQGNMNLHTPVNEVRVIRM